MNLKQVLVCICLTSLLLLSSCNIGKTVVESKKDFPEGRLYVLNQGSNTIYIYDTKTLERLASFNSEVEEPHFIEFSPDGQYYYVISRRIGGLIAKFKTSNNQLLAKAATGIFPTSLVIDNNNIAYVGDFTLVKGHIHRFDVSGETIVFMDSVLQSGFQTHDIGITPDRMHVVAAGYGSDDVTTFDIQTQNLIPLTLDSANIGFNPASNNYGPYGVQLDHTGNRIILACSKGADQMRIIDLFSRTIIDSILIPVKNDINPDRNGPTYMDLATDNDILFVSNFLDNTLAVVQLSTLSVLKMIEFQKTKPFSVVLSGDGSQVYVSCTGTRPELGTVYIIDAKTYQKLDSIEVGVAPFGINWRPL